MKILFAILCLIICLSITDGKAKGRNKKKDDGQYHRGETFKRYMIRFRSRKFYPQQELARRERNVIANAERAVRHNMRANTTYKQGLNIWSDMNSENFTRRLCGARPPKEMRALPQYIKPAIPAGPYPKSVDWRHLMQPIKTQGTCGSCWSFSTAAVIEGQLKLRNSSFNSYLSREQLVECSTVDNGCDGGWPAKTIRWLIKNGNKLALEEDYPYVLTDHKDGEAIPVCRAVNTSHNLNIIDVANFPIRNEEALEAYVATHGPVAVAMHVHPTNGKYQNYISGIFQDSECPNDADMAVRCRKCNHAMVVVGYGIENDIKYWIVRNSWGETWGENGYVRMIKGKDNNCNIACWMIWPIFKI